MFQCIKIQSLNVCFLWKLTNSQINNVASLGLKFRNVSEMDRMR